MLYLSLKLYSSLKLMLFETKIIITLFEFTAYSHVDEVDVVLVVLVVDVIEAKLELILCLSRNKCQPQDTVLLVEVDVVLVIEVVLVVEVDAV